MACIRQAQVHWSREQNQKCSNQKLLLEITLKIRMLFICHLQILTCTICPFQFGNLDFSTALIRANYLWSLSQLPNEKLDPGNLSSEDLGLAISPSVYVPFSVYKISKPHVPLHVSSLYTEHSPKCHRCLLGPIHLFFKRLIFIIFQLLCCSFYKFHFFSVQTKIMLACQQLTRPLRQVCKVSHFDKCLSS